ncbi:unnamed protein product, partial [Ectocarpus fasciculatus]
CFPGPAFRGQHGGGQLPPHHRGKRREEKSDEAVVHRAAGGRVHGDRTFLHLPQRGRVLRQRRGGDFRTDLRLLPVDQERQHRLHDVGLPDGVGLLLHGGRVGRVRIHHQHHPHLRGGDGSRRPLQQPPVHRLLHVLRPRQHHGNAGALCGFQRGQAGGMHGLPRGVHRYPGVCRGALPLQRDRRQGSAARLPCRGGDPRVRSGGGARGGAAAGARAVDRALADSARPHLRLK